MAFGVATNILHYLFITCTGIIVIGFVFASPILQRPLFPNLTQFQDLNQSMGSIRKASMCANNYNFAILSPPQQLLVYRRRTLSYRIFVASSQYQRILDCHRWILSYRIFTVSSRHWQILNYRHVDLEFSYSHHLIKTSTDLDNHRYIFSPDQDVNM